MINANGQLGTATTTSPPTSNDTRSQTDSRLDRQQHEIDTLKAQNEHLAAEIAQLQALIQHR